MTETVVVVTICPWAELDALRSGLYGALLGYQHGSAYTELLQKFDAGSRDMDDSRAKRLRTAVGGISVGGTAADAPPANAASLDKEAKAAQLAKEQQEEAMRVSAAAAAKEEQEAAEAAAAAAAKKQEHEDRLDKIDKEAREAALDKLAQEAPVSDGEDLGASLSLAESLQNQAAADRAKAEKAKAGNAWKLVGKPTKASPPLPVLKQTSYGALAPASASGTASRRAASAAPRAMAPKG